MKRLAVSLLPLVAARSGHLGSAAAILSSRRLAFKKEVPIIQYVVPFAYKIRWTMKMNLREAIHIGELRTMPQGHPDYRFIVQEMWKEIRQVHPTLAEYAKFIDWKTYRLGRLQSEMKTEYKRATLERDTRRRR